MLEINQSKRFHLISVLQRLAEFVRFCVVRGDNVSHSLGLVIDNIHCDFGTVFGGGVSEAGCQLGVNNTSAHIQIGINIDLSSAAN